MPDPKQITIPGYDTDSNGQLVSATLNYDMGNGPGSPITVQAFKVMVKRYIDNATQIGDTNKTAVVDFGKASILRVLGQKGCEGIRFWFAIPDSGVGVSLALEGLDEKGFPLQQSTTAIDFSRASVPQQPHLSSDPKHEEKGNGLSVAEVIKRGQEKVDFRGLNNQQIILKTLAEEWKP